MGFEKGEICKLEGRFAYIGNPGSVIEISDVEAIFTGRSPVMGDKGYDEFEVRQEEGFFTTYFVPKDNRTGRRGFTGSSDVGFYSSTVTGREGLEELPEAAQNE